MVVKFQPLEVRSTGEFGLALCTAGLHGLDNQAVYRNMNATMDNTYIDFVLSAHRNGSDIGCGQNKVAMVYTYFEVVTT